MSEEFKTWPEVIENNLGLPDIEFSIVAGLYSMQKELHKLLSHKIQSELSVIQLEVLNRINEKGFCTSSELATVLRVSKANITGVTRRMEEKGFIKKKPDPKDSRSNILTITKKGEKKINDTLPHFIDAMTKDLKEMPPREKEIINKYLINLFYTLSHRNED